MGADAESQMFEVDLRSFLQIRCQLLLIPKIVIGSRRIRLAMTLVIFDRGSKVLGSRFADGGRLV